MDRKHELLSAEVRFSTGKTVTLHPGDTIDMADEGMIAWYPEAVAENHRAEMRDQQPEPRTEVNHIERGVHIGDD